MRVAFLYNRSSEDPAKVAEDEVPSRSPVVAALRQLGHDVTPIACTLDLASARRRLEQAAPDVVFNRVESLGGSDAMMAAVTLLLDTMGLPYTGCGTAALVAAADKVATKKRLVEAGLPTPGWITADCGLQIADCGLHGCSPNPQHEIRNPKYILKSVYEHASFQLNDSSVIDHAQPADIATIVGETSLRFGRPFFAEEFIDGREFNLSLLGSGPEVMPPAEIDFSAFPAGKPRIVGHGAKWDESSFEFHNTSRRFDYPASDKQLLQRLSEMALKCWQLFELRGYARVDFRCDIDGQPWILEINTNPCISPDAGFATAVERAGFTYEEGIGKILDAAMPQNLAKLSSSSSRQSPAAR